MRTKSRGFRLIMKNNSYVSMFANVYDAGRMFWVGTYSVHYKDLFLYTGKHVSIFRQPLNFVNEVLYKLWKYWRKYSLALLLHHFGTGTVLFIKSFTRKKRNTNTKQTKIFHDYLFWHLTHDGWQIDCNYLNFLSMG